MDDPTKPLDMTSASTETRQRSAKLYGLLASLCRNRSLNVVRSVKQADGFEALRQLTLTLRPSTNNRGLALMAALTAWPPFNMQQTLQPQLLLRLEEALEEAKKAGSTIPDQLQQAILLKCVSGQLRTHLNLAIQDSTTFSELREQVLKWDRSQQRWSTLVFAEDNGGQRDMDIDRIYDWPPGGKKGGKGKGKGNGAYDQKGKGKNNYKGKGKSNDGKNGMKGKQKGVKGKGKSGGKPDNNKGKGKTVETCRKCGKPGHYARDCWSTVRNMQTDGQVGQPANTPAGSPTNSPAQSQQEQGPSQQQSQATQYRVARIQVADGIIEYCSDVQQHDEFVFDMRSPSSNASGSVRVMSFYIGDEPNDAMREPYEFGVIRTMLEDVDDDCSMQTILLDSGADASVFPASMCELGTCSEVQMGNLRDAQGRKIPLHGVRDIEVHLMDVQGKSVTLRETVALSNQITQPILCFGRLLEGGWSVNGVEQTLTHANGVAAPIELQNRSMTVKGWIRTIKERGPEFFDMQIRAVSASVFEELTDARVGWNLNERGVGIGKRYSNCFQDPTLACPSMSGRMYRTTLIKHGDKWLVLELCEPLEYLVDLSAEFYGYAGDRYVITIITDAERPPQVMGFRLLDDEPELAQDQHPSEEDVAIPLAPEDEEVIGIDIDGDAEQAQQEGQDLEGQLVFVPERTDKLNVNGVEVTQDSTLAVLRQACTYYNISTSGSKTRCFSRLLEHQKRLELQTLVAAARNAEQEQRRQPVPQRLEQVPDEKTQRPHFLTHTPYAAWCEHCVMHRARQDPHKKDGSVKFSGTPTVSFDFAYTKAIDAARPGVEVDAVVALVMVDSATNYVSCVPMQRTNST